MKKAMLPDPTRVRALGTLLVVLALMIGARPGQGAETGVLRATLDNGLRVVIVRNTLAPVVATSVNYLVGSDEAPAGFPGTAHAQEHMMFRGSPDLTADQLAVIGSVMGGTFNANTRESLTQYLYTVPAEDVEVALHIESLRMLGVLDSQADWDHERGAIEQEVAQDMSSPEYVLYAKLRAAMFAGTPYEHDALGTRPSFDKTTAAMLKRFYDTWYAPNNAILIVVGNLDPAATLGTIKKLFGGISPKKLPARPQVNPAPARAKSLRIDTDHPNGTQMLAMRMPGLDSPDFPALEVLADILASHRFDLYGLVPQGKALDASFTVDPLPQASIGYATVSFTAGSDSAAIDKDVRHILATVIRDGVPAELVEAAKSQERRQAESQKNSIEGLASVWADAIALYGLKSPDEDLTRIEKVSVADVNRVARKYLDLGHAVSATIVPHGSGRPVSTSGGFGGQESIALGEATDTKLPDWAEDALSRLVPPPSTLDPVVSTLSNGMTLIVQPEDVSNTVNVYGHIKARPEIEVAHGKEGVDEVLEQLFQYGSESLDRLHFQQSLDRLGADERAGAEFSIQVQAQDFDSGVALLADNELHPSLPKQALEVIGRQYAQMVSARDHSPGHLAHRALLQGLFPRNDPTQREASAESIRSITLDDVRAYYRQAFRPDLATIVVMGRISPEQARATIEKYFGSWSATGPKPETNLPAVAPNSAATVAVPDASRVQDNVTLAQTMTLTRDDPDYYALQLGTAVLGGGFYSTRLSIDLRKNAGLVYSVGAHLQSGKTRSVYIVQFASDPKNVSTASNIVSRDLRNMQSALVPEDELTRSKALLLRQIPLSEASIDAIAGGLFARRDLDLPLDEPVLAARRYIDIRPDEVQAAFRKWIRPDELVSVSQGPPPH
jgi:zinc protease